MADMETFNPSDAFDAATEAFRRDIAGLIHHYWTKAPETTALNPDARFQSIAIALTVSLAVTMKIMVDAPEKDLINMVKQALPSAFSTAGELVNTEADPREVRH